MLPQMVANVTKGANATEKGANVTFVTFVPFLVQMLPVRLKCYRVVTFAPFSVQLLPEFSSFFFLEVFANIGRIKH